MDKCVSFHGQFIYRVSGCNGCIVGLEAFGGQFECSAFEVFSKQFKCPVSE
jgi:hypothetical protein